MTLLVWLVVIALAVLPAAVPWARSRRANPLALALHDAAPASADLEFRCALPGDVDALLLISGDEASVSANGWDDATVEKNAAFLRSPKGFAVYRTIALLAVKGPGGPIVGIATIAPMQPGNSEALETPSGLSIGLQMHPDHRGRGYGAELTAAAIAVFSRACLGDIWLGTVPSNAPIRAIMSRLGYTPEPGVLPHHTPSGEVFDSLWYRCRSGSLS